MSLRSLFAATLLGLASLAQAAGYPTKPVTIVVPFAAGGSSDMVGRVLGQKMGEKLGGTFIVENKPGATGAIGAALVKNAPPDGYTLLVSSIAVFVINPHLQKDLAYDPSKDLDLLSVAVQAPNVLIANPQLPVNSVADVIALLKKSPGKYSFVSSGAGSTDHLTAEIFWQSTGTSGIHVPYKGGAPAIQDVIAGHGDFSFQNINAVLPQIQAGKLKALAITSAARSPLLPNVPTLTEAGVKDGVVYSWQAVAGPKGLPADVKAKLHGAIVGALRDPDVQKKFTELGFEIVANTPEQFARYQQQELARWKTVIENGKIVAN
jgi:tripartite-type tricarboxylate transporter receptor subunit TctC